MKIAYILPSFTILSGSAGGIKMQAEQWKKALIGYGHEVVEISEWGNYDWKSFNVIHFFYFGFSYVTIYQALKARCPHARFVCSPIIDTIAPIWLFRILTILKIKRIKLWCEPALLRHYEKIFDLFLVRSTYEMNFLSKAFGISLKKIMKVPLDYRLDMYNPAVKKENFCLHVSRICDPGKNVVRLVKAAIKFKFHLKLAGASTEEFNERLRKLIGTNSNIEILGRVTDEELVNLYNRAKVFALPSLREGVGLVALEAAIHGCDVVITSIGGPKEYFLPYATVVNPYNINEIGKSISMLLEGDGYQPVLKEEIIRKYNPAVIAQSLEEAYQNVLGT